MPLDGGMMIVVDPSGLPRIGTHRTRWVVLGQAEPYQVFHAVALHNGHHRLTEGRHRRKPFFPTTALVEGLNLRHRLGHTGAKRRLGRLRMPHRSHHQASLAPALNLAVSLVAHRHGIFITLCDRLRLTLWPFSNDRAEDVFTIADRLKGRVALAFGQLHLSQRAQVKITRGSDPGSRLPRRHLAVTDI